MPGTEAPKHATIAFGRRYAFFISVDDDVRMSTDIVGRLNVMMHFPNAIGVRIGVSLVPTTG